MKCGIVVVMYGQIIASNKTNSQVTGDGKGSTVFTYLLPGLSVQFANLPTKTPKLYVQEKWNSAACIHKRVL